MRCGPFVLLFGGVKARSSAVIVALIACSGCGSSSGSDLFAGGKSAAPGKSGSGGAANGGGTSAPAGESGSRNTAGDDSAGGENGVAGFAGRPVLDAGLGAGGVLSVSDAAMPRADAGPSGLNTPSPGSIECAGMACVIAGTPTNTCCVGPLPFPTSCLPTFPGCVNGGGMPIGCDDAADCPNGQLCCGNLSGQSAGSRCAATCPSPSIQICRTHAECHSRKCAPIFQAPQYGACQ
jgi:hypothetical protein